MSLVTPSVTEIKTQQAPTGERFHRAFAAENRKLFGERNDLKTSLERLGEQVLADLAIDDLDGAVSRNKTGWVFNHANETDHIYTMMETNRETLGMKEGCDLAVLFDGDKQSSRDPQVTMKARWRENGDGKVTVSNTLIEWKKRGSKNTEPDFTVYFDPVTGRMTGMEVNDLDVEMKNTLRVVMPESRRGIRNRVDFSDDQTGYQEACSFLATQLSIHTDNFSEGIDVKKTLANFITDGRVVEKGGAVTPVLARRYQ